MRTQDRRFIIRVLSLSVVLLILGLSTVATGQTLKLATASTTSPQASTAAGTYFDHVVVVIMEDHGIQEICGSSPPPCQSTMGAPYMAGLANGYAIGSQYLGVTHYSQADYLAMLGGTTDNCSSAGCPWPFNGPNLVDRLEAAGLTWKGYMENQNMASGCDLSYHQPYTPEHNPFVGFTDIVNSPTRCSQIVLANPSGCSMTDCPLINDLNSGSAPNFMWLTPNNCDNMHGFTYTNGTVLCPTSVSFGDSYLSSLVPNILKSTTFTTQRSALFVVFDEGNGYCPLNQSTTEDCVYAVWAGPLAKANYGTTNLYNHYSWLRTVEVNWNLQALTSNDANATPMAEFFAPPLSAIFSYNPSSPQVGQQVTFSASASGGTTPYSFSWSFGDGASGTGSSTSHTYSSAGTFNVVLTVKDSSSPQQTATSQQSVSVSSPPPGLTASFVYSPSSPQIGQQVTFTASASGGTAPYTDSWSFGKGSSATHTYSSAGSFTVTLTVKDSGVPQQTVTSQKTVTVTSPPPPLSASFTYSPSSPQVGQTVSFTGSASGGTSPYSYSWSFGDGSTGTGSSVTHTYASTGSFTIVLTVSDSSSPQQTTTSQQSITVSSTPPALTASFTYSPSSPQAGQQVTFTASASGGTTPYTFSWSFGDGSTGTGSSVTHSYSSPGSFTVTLTVKDSSSPQQTASSQHTVTVSSASPTLTTSFTYSPSSPEVGQQVTFTATVSGGTSPYSYSWNFGDGATGTGSSVAHAYTSAGTFIVALTVKDSGSPQQTASSQQSITVSNPPPTLTASFTYSPSSPQAGQQVTFTASAIGGTTPYTFSWSFGDGSTGTGSSVTHSYSSFGSFTVTLTVKDSSSPQQTATSQNTVTVSSPPPTLAASFTFSPSSPQAGQQVTFAASATGGTTPYSYTWTFGDGSTGTGSSVTHTYSSAGSYTVTLTAKDSGSPQQTATSQNTVTVTSPPPPLSASFTYSPSSPLPLLPVTFDASASGGTQPYSYRWDFGDGSTGSRQSVSHSYLLLPSYTVSQ